MNDQPADETQPIAPQGDDQESGGRSSRGPIIAGVGVLVAGVLGVGAYAGVQLLGGGPQPADALPDSVIAYASVDINPGASQKIEAVRALRKFPDLRERLEVDEDDDIRKRIFEEAVAGTDCEDEVTFDDDIEPWLGDRAAIAAVDLGGDEPSPVFALQVSDKDAAEQGVEALRECGGEGEPSDDFSSAFNEGYLLISDGEDNAAKLVEEAAEGTLADDDGFAEWTDKAGGDGIISFYVSKRAAEVLLDVVPPEVSSQAGDVESALESFEGMAGAVRFADGGLELEIAAEGGEEFVGDAELGDQLTQLPGDTAVAVGFGIPEDFAETLTDQLENAFGGQSDSMVAEAEAQTGLDLPEDLQTLLGEAALLALGGDAPENLAETSGPGDIPFGLKIIGDADEIEAVVAKAEERAGSQLADAGLVQDSTDGAFVLATNEEFAEALKEEGSLGDNENFRDVVPEADNAAFALFIDFDSAWRTALINTFAGPGADSSEAARLEDNTEPLGALGISAWRDGDTSHALVKLTTD